MYLTASGGPLRELTRTQLRHVSRAQVLAHPRWKMGAKITVDSSTLMNKGLEYLEAQVLFGLSAGQIEVLIHPEAIIHSMVEYVDGVILAQLSQTDMRIPLQYALTYPCRLRGFVKPLDFFRLKALHFEKPDVARFPCLALAYEAARAQGTLACVMNAANEVAVDAFLRDELVFTAIARVTERVMRAHRNSAADTLDTIFAADRWARARALQCIQERK